MQTPTGGNHDDHGQRHQSRRWCDTEEGLMRLVEEAQAEQKPDKGTESPGRIYPERLVQPCRLVDRHSTPLTPEYADMEQP